MDELGYIQTDLYRKKTAVNSLLHAESSHPLPLIKSIPVGQFLRAKRICSKNEDFEKQATQLTNRFRARGYHPKWIEAGYKRARGSERNQLLVEKQKVKNTFATQEHGPTRSPTLFHVTPRE